MKELVYLASPYTTPSLVEEHTRWVNTCIAAAELINQGYMVFSPIAHTHPIKIYGDLEGHWEMWKEYDERMITNCDSLFVLTIEGWDKSKGVAEEVKFAQRLGKPIYYVNPVTFLVTPSI